MEWMIWIGAAITLVGLAGIIWSIRAVTRARKQGLTDDALRERLTRVLPVNIGALLLSVLGLMCVTVGVILG